MKLKILHSWDVSPERAVEIQKELMGEIIYKDELGEVRFIAGVDVGFESAGNITRAGVALLKFPSLELKEARTASLATTFPYVPGLLSFREIPAISEALSDLTLEPDLILCDGHGLAHPRRFGLACHLGLLSEVPTIGVAKSRLIGDYDPVEGPRGSQSLLKDNDEVIGSVLRTRSGIKPIYVSVGHKISLDTAIEYVLRCAPRYRLPEPIRKAHRLASG